MPNSSLVLLIGASGHAKVVIELLRAGGVHELRLIVEKQSCPPILGVPLVGLDSDLPRLKTEGAIRAFVAIGDNGRRLERGREIERNAISPRALMSPTARIGWGIAVMGGAVINAEAQIDDFAIVNTGAGSRSRDTKRLSRDLAGTKARSALWAGRSIATNKPMLVAVMKTNANSENKNSLVPNKV